MSHSKRSKTVLGVVLAAMLAFSACGGEGNDSDSQGASEESSAQEKSEGGQQPEGPDLEGIPDVVAEVNGEEVTKEEFVATYEPQFQQAAMQAQMSGQKPDEDALKKQAVDSLVDTELLRQEADDRGISATEKDVDNTLTGLAKQNKMASAEEFLAALKKQGTSEDLVRSQVETRVVVEQLVEDEAGSVKPTEGELRKIYDDAVRQQKKAGKQGGQQQPIPPFAKVKSQLVQQATSDKQGKAAQALVKDLRKDAEINVNL
ncbi:MAG: SurA N-terminal domain-containing protein [Nocardioides sp.]|nr:SurA N-terminal domain-containing protein [Nocardioides sp.]